TSSAWGERSTTRRAVPARSPRRGSAAGTTRTGSTRSSATRKRSSARSSTCRASRCSSRRTRRRRARARRGRRRRAEGRAPSTALRARSGLLAPLALHLLEVLLDLPAQLDVVGLCALLRVVEDRARVLEVV